MIFSLDMFTELELTVVMIHTDSWQYQTAGVSPVKTESFPSLSPKNWRWQQIFLFPGYHNCTKKNNLYLNCFKICPIHQDSYSKPRQSETHISIPGNPRSDVTLCQVVASPHQIKITTLDKILPWTFIKSLFHCHIKTKS